MMITDTLYILDEVWVNYHAISGSGRVVYRHTQNHLRSNIVFG
jgi:hypothetical protein